MGNVESLQPSEIRYTQDSISVYFKHGTKIGETLDGLCEGRIEISAIPKIKVFKLNGDWYTTGNRRLWVFRHLERLGKCSSVPVEAFESLPPVTRFTTNNKGKDVKLRGGDPGGKWYAESPGWSTGLKLALGVGAVGAVGAVSALAAEESTERHQVVKYNPNNRSSETTVPTGLKVLGGVIGAGLVVAGMVGAKALYDELNESNTEEKQKFSERRRRSEEQRSLEYDSYRWNPRYQSYN